MTQLKNESYFQIFVHSYYFWRVAQHPTVSLRYENNPEMSSKAEITSIVLLIFTAFFVFIVLACTVLHTSKDSWNGNCKHCSTRIVRLCHMMSWDPMRHPTSPRSGISLVPVVHPIPFSHGTLGSDRMSHCPSPSPSPCPDQGLVVCSMGKEWTRGTKYISLTCD